MNELLKRHIAHAKGNILILVTDKTESPTQEAVANLDRITLSRVHSDSKGRLQFQSDPNEHYSLVICIGRDSAETHRLYTLANPYKDKGIPVVFGNTQRGLIFNSPDWRDVDLNMSGMYYLANSYIRSIGSKGSYAEFGVFDGRSMTLAFQSLKSSVDKFFAFDSFGGIVGSKENEINLYPEGSYYANIETFWHNMHVANCDIHRMVAIKGAFQDTLVNGEANEITDRYSIVLIDSDIYEAALLVLNYIKPRLLPGALILFDEYHTFGADPNRGERRAVREWLAANPDVTLEHYRNFTAFGAAFIFRPL